MRVRRLKIGNFRGIREGTIDFVGHTLLVGGNNVCKSTICEALDLVLGPERLYRRPVVDEHDFHRGAYLDGNGNPSEIRIEAILADLSEEAVKRFSSHLRRWDEKTGDYVDAAEKGPAASDGEKTCWVLPVVFIGKYDKSEDDFFGNTFFSHPIQPVDEEEEEEIKIGAGLSYFSKNHKRFCGFVFLRALRTGSRALSLQRGSLLDTILRLGGDGLNEMWEDTLAKLRNLDPPIGEIDQLKPIRSEITKRMSRFVNLAPGEDATAFFASDLTRANLREVVKFFVASEKSAHLLPFQKMGTGTLNVLVFALLTFIAELKGKQNVIFAMEEPEIALPPHTQRRIARFILGEMGQAIVTSHSPYIIEQFEPEQIVMLERADEGKIAGRPVDIENIKPKSFKAERRQFAEAVLARAVFVVEGATEIAVFQAASEIMEQYPGEEKYSDLDYIGVSLFDAGGDGSVPRYGPIFKALGKKSYGWHDEPKAAFTQDQQQQLAQYDQSWQSPYQAIEKLLVEEMPTSVLDWFLQTVKTRADYPVKCGQPAANMTDDQTKKLTEKVLLARKGNGGYAALLVSHCKNADELPESIKTALQKISDDMNIVPLEDEDSPEDDIEEKMLDVSQEDTDDSDDILGDTGTE